MGVTSGRMKGPKRGKQKIKATASKAREYDIITED